MQQNGSQNPHSDDSIYILEPELWYIENQEMISQQANHPKADNKSEGQKSEDFLNNPLSMLEWLENNQNATTNVSNRHSIDRLMINQQPSNSLLNEYQFPSSLSNNENLNLSTPYQKIQSTIAPKEMAKRKKEQNQNSNDLSQDEEPKRQKRETSYQSSSQEKSIIEIEEQDIKRISESLGLDYLFHTYDDCFRKSQSNLNTNDNSATTNYKEN